MRISRNLHKKTSQVSTKTRSTPASLSFKTRQLSATVKWSIALCWSVHMTQQQQLAMSRNFHEIQQRSMAGEMTFLREVLHVYL